MKIHIRGGRVIDPANNIDQVRDLFIDDSRIVDSQLAGSDFTADQTIDATGKVVCPGLVDLQARLREPGEEHKATMQSELSAAVAGGVTSVCVPPDTYAMHP